MSNQTTPSKFSSILKCKCPTCRTGEVFTHPATSWSDYNKMNEYCSNGTYYFKSGSMVKKYFQELIDLDINLKGEYYVSLVYNLIVRDGLNVGIFEIEKEHHTTWKFTKVGQIIFQKNL